MPRIRQKDFELAKLFIISDIERELELAKASGRKKKRKHLRAAGLTRLGGGNLLAALGLLCYTEFCGALEFDRRDPKNTERAAPGENFDAFFNKLDGEGRYEAFNDEHRVYGLFRCGMAHQYFAKEEFTVAMPKDNSDPNGIGITYAPDKKRYKFYVATYFRDLRKGLDRLTGKLTFPIALPDR